MTKERLRKYASIKKEKEQIEQRLASLEAAMYAPKVPHMTGMPSGPPGSDIMADLVARHMELMDCYRGKLAALVAEQMEIERAIEPLNPTLRTLLRCRYIDGLTWEEVCVELNYSWRQTHRIHSQALKELSKKEEAPE